MLKMIENKEKHNLEVEADEKSDYIHLGKRGKLSKKNKLNELTGKEWIKFTKSWFILSPKRREETVLLHPGKFPEVLAERYISFFTKKGEKILDPMAGTGTVNYVCDKLGRVGYSIELEEKYYNIGNSRSKQHFFLGDCRDIWEFDIPMIDLIITSPPYWNSLKKNDIRQHKRKTKGLDTEYSLDEKNFENIGNYKKFINELTSFYKYLKEFLKPSGYFVLIVNNVYKNSKLYPLAFDLAIKLSKFYVLKDEQIWCQNDKNLVALGVNNAYVGNRHHVYCLIFRNDDF